MFCDSYSYKNLFLYSKAVVTGIGGHYVFHTIMQYFIYFCED